MEKILNGKRFDLFAKYIYLKHYLLDIKSDWYIRLYKDHILVFNGGWEHPGFKKDPEDFVTSFNSLIKSVSENGYNPICNEIQINSNNILLNNAHRFIIAYHLAMWPPIIVESRLNFSKGYDYTFFSDRLRHGTEGIPSYAVSRISDTLQPLWMNAMALEACRIKKDTKVITMFPKADTNKDSDVDALLNQNGTIIYKTTVQLNENGRVKYVEELYLGEQWVGYTRADKSRDTFGPFPVRVYFFTPNNKVDIITLKHQLRDIYGSRDTVHINDTQEEAIRYASAILHGVHYLNYGKDLSSANQKMFDEYKEIIKNKRSEFLCIDSSFVLALYGLRDARDLDFIHHSAYDLSDFPPSEFVHDHNSEAQYHNKTIDDLIFNPENHFYVNGCKVVSLDVVKSMKERRGEEKDKLDIVLINRLLDLTQLSL